MYSIFQINFNFRSVNIEGVELHNMGQLTDIGIVSKSHKLPIIAYYVPNMRGS